VTAPKFLWLIAVTTESEHLELKVRNIRSIDSQAIIVIACNNTNDETVKTARKVGDYVFVYGPIGKCAALFAAYREVLPRADRSWNWIVFSDVNTVVTRWLSIDDLNAMQDSNLSVIYGSVERYDASKNFRARPSFSLRLRIDEFFGQSSGAYGALYLLHFECFEKALSELRPVQNDDYVIPALTSMYGKRVLASAASVLETESLDFYSEFRRKRRDAKGHVGAIRELISLGHPKKRWYPILARATVWLALWLALAALIAIPVINVGLGGGIYGLLLIALIFRPKFRGKVARIGGFYLGFLQGLVGGQQLRW